MLNFHFSFDNINYLFALDHSETEFSLHVIDEDYFDRWSGIFNEEFVKQMTLTAGSQKSLAEFLKMLRAAFMRSSSEIQLMFLTPQKFEPFQFKPLQNIITSTNDCRLFILRHSTSLETINFPLILESNPFSEIELKEKIFEIAQENQIIRNSLIPTHQEEEILELEQQISKLQNLIDSFKASAISSLNDQKKILKDQQLNKTREIPPKKGNKRGKTEKPKMNKSVLSPPSKKSQLASNDLIDSYHKDQEELNNVMKQIRILRAALLDNEGIWS